MRRASNPVHRAFLMRRAYVFLVLWRALQCVTPALCAAPQAQRVTPLKFAQFSLKLTPFLQHEFLLFNFSSLNANELFEDDQRVYMQELLIFHS